MLRVFGSLVVFILLASGVLAADTAQAVAQSGVQASIEEANRYLSAENTRALNQMKIEIANDLKGYQDENFRELDGRMQTLMYDTKMRVILGGIGSMLLASGLVALGYMWITRRYSYEAYLQDVIKKYEVAGGTIEFKRPGPPEMRGIEEVQNPEGWNYGQPLQSMTGAGRIDQEQAAMYSQLNEHQYDPAYQGAWVPEQGVGMYEQDLDNRTPYQEPEQPEMNQWRPN